MPNPVSRRTALRYKRLRSLIGVLANALLDQPQAAASPATTVMINDMFALARQVFSRLAGVPRFDAVAETAPLSNFDMRLVLMRLDVACTTFDRQYEDKEPAEPERHEEPEAYDDFDDPYEGYDPADVERILADDYDPPPRTRTPRMADAAADATPPIAHHPTSPPQGDG